MKKIFSLVIMTIFIFNSTSVIASRTEFDTDGICHIEGEIKSVIFVEAFRDSCLESDSCPIGAYSPDRPARYDLTILIYSGSCVTEKCGYINAFHVNSEMPFYLLKDLLREGDKLKPGQKISGNVEYFFGHSFKSYKIEKSD